MSEVYSHSRLSSFEDCPKKFHFRYVLRVPSETESVEQFVGKRVHEVLERLYIATGKGFVPTLAQVLKRFELLWDEHYVEDRIRIVRRENSIAFYRSIGERCLTHYYRRFYPFDSDETLGLEKPVQFSLDEHGSYRLRGVVDRIVRAPDEAIEIHDYKTSRRIPSQKRLDRDRQLALYQLALAKLYGADQPIRLVWHYLQHDKVRTSTRTPEQLEDLRAHTIELIDKIRVEKNFETRTSPLCGWCEYRDICPAHVPREQYPLPNPDPRPPVPQHSEDASEHPVPAQMTLPLALGSLRPSPRRGSSLASCESAS